MQSSTLADPSRTPGTHPVQFLLFSCSFRKKFGQMIGWRPALWCKHPCLGNPGAATVWIKFMKMNKIRGSQILIEQKFCRDHLTNHLYCLLITTRKVIFTGICDSVHMGVAPGQVPPGPGTPPWAPRDQVHPLGPGTPPGTRYTPDQVEQTLEILLYFH